MSNDMSSPPDSQAELSTWLQVSLVFSNSKLREQVVKVLTKAGYGTVHRLTNWFRCLEKLESSGVIEICDKITETMRETAPLCNIDKAMGFVLGMMVYFRCRDYIKQPPDGWSQTTVSGGGGGVDDTAKSRERKQTKGGKVTKNGGKATKKN